MAVRVTTYGAIAKALGVSPLAVTRAPSENPRLIEIHVRGS
ncbi:MAG: 6-O-methylguanine DNA methyltransferase, DNA binding domain [uncultured Acidilobus sp. OSP8]|jgi:hypothetical protein|nr:MAG: 6-O-methylguanine DNA methyltransferase, DNA binding domain [uncultured Acidilobus sp. OSP8]